MKVKKEPKSSSEDSSSEEEHKLQNKRYPVSYHSDIYRAESTYKS